MKIINHLFLIFLSVKLSINSSTVIYKINQAVFLNPQTNSSLIQCPLSVKYHLTIQWYDVINNRLVTDNGEYYRINGLQPYDRELICWSISRTGHETNEKYQIRIRMYGKNTVHRCAI